ncbi:MAG TPA: hypothetical protein PLP39_00495 [Flavobacterium lutivivi]|nr:hypothetical protein [Flavobacterium lutivivi]
MEVKFEMIRIGKFRKDDCSEMLLKQNVDLLKSTIRYHLADIDNIENKPINIDMIVPAKGFEIKIFVKRIRDKNIRTYLKENFPKSIYNGNYSNISDNLNNPIFKNS